MKILKFLGLLMLSAVVSIAQSIPAPPEASAAEVAAGTIGTKYVSPRRLSAAPLTTAQLNAAFGSTQGSILYRNASGWTQLTPGTSGQLLSTQGAAANPIWVTATGGAGDVNGPTLGTATDNAIVRFDGTGGKTVQNSAVTIADTTGSISINGTDTATAVNTGGFKSANFGLSTASGGASYFGGLVATGGRLGINAAPVGYAGAYLGGIMPNVGGDTTGAGYLSAGTFPASFTGGAHSFYSLPASTASAYTVTNMSGFYAGAPTKGAGSTITNLYGVYVESLTQGVNNYAFYSAGATPSYFGGATTFAGAVTTSSATLSGAGAIPITTSLVKFTSTGGAQALTLANGTDGQRLTIVHDVDGGSGVLTPTTKTGFSTITFTNAGDTVDLVYVTTRGWMVTGSYLATIAP